MIELNSQVVIKLTQVSGVVVGRAEYAWTDPSYLVEFVDAQGNARRDWFDEYQISQIQ